MHYRKHCSNLFQNIFLIQNSSFQENAKTKVYALEDSLGLRNLLTHTVNNLLQTLNNVKSIDFFVVKQKFNIIHIMCENFKTMPWVLCKIQRI